MENNDEFTPAIRATFQSYPRLEAPRDFEARILEAAHAQRAQNPWRRFWEIEIEGVAVWRLVGSTLSGGLFSAAILGLGWALSRPTALTSAPKSPVPVSFAQLRGPLYAREWEWEFQERDFQTPRPVLEPKTAAKEEFSCASFSARLA